MSFASLRSAKSLKLHTISGTHQVSRVYVQYLVRSPRSQTPAEPAHPSMKHIGFRTIFITGLNRFALSHCGSRTPLPTLKPRLTASAPRLSTGCLPSFTGLGVSPSYTTRTEPAHPRENYTTKQREKPVFSMVSTHFPCSDSGQSCYRAVGLRLLDFQSFHEPAVLLRR